MVLGVLLRRVFVVLVGVQGMPVRDAGMMRGLFVVARLVMLRRFAMVLGRMFVMVRGMLVMLVNLVIVHCRLPDWWFSRNFENCRDQ